MASDGSTSRWEVRCEDGVPRGGLYELEYEVIHRVLDRRTGQEVLTFQGEFSGSLSRDGGDWEGGVTGVTRVEISPDDRWALVHRSSSEEPERWPLPPEVEDGAEAG